MIMPADNCCSAATALTAKLHRAWEARNAHNAIKCVHEHREMNKCSLCRTGCYKGAAIYTIKVTQLTAGRQQIKLTEMFPLPNKSRHRMEWKHKRWS